MAKRLTVRIPHALSQQDAALRLDDFIRRSLVRHQASVSEFVAGWDMHRLEGRLKAKGQAIAASLEVGEREVVFSLDLPFVLGVVSGKIETRLRNEVMKALRPA